MRRECPGCGLHLSAEEFTRGTLAMATTDGETNVWHRDCVTQHHAKDGAPVLAPADQAVLIDRLQLQLARACAKLHREGWSCGHCELHWSVLTDSKPGHFMMHYCGSRLLAMDDEVEHEIFMCPCCVLTMDRDSIEIGDYDVKEIPKSP